ncbi:hypothetical protein CDAR_222241 [Caerostris darwini]|uniref:Uncharacterized protein n=1 Tax=Caerostris darwini TaxID=1538125 RepID=A0AAV4UB35_9ARAC|nr:hypothetical protein CDAR_222241 [Caerostris darwini]
MKSHRNTKSQSSMNQDMWVDRNRYTYPLMSETNETNVHNQTLVECRPVPRNRKCLGLNSEGIRIFQNKHQPHTIGERYHQIPQGNTKSQSSMNQDMWVDRNRYAYPLMFATNETNVHNQTFVEFRPIPRDRKCLRPQQ